MIELDFTIAGAEIDRFAASPYIDFELRIDARAPDLVIRNVMLDCQVRIESARRRYDAAEQERLVDLFGEPDRWSRTLQTLLWSHAHVQVPAFRGSTLVNLPVACSFDFNAGATKYFHGLATDAVPLVFLFSGTVFHDVAGTLQLDQIPWTSEARHRLPVATWQALMRHFYPESVWFRLPHAVFDRLGRYKRTQGIATWELAVERLLDESGAGTSSGCNAPGGDGEGEGAC